MRLTMYIKVIFLFLLSVNLSAQDYSYNVTRYFDENSTKTLQTLDCKDFKPSRLIVNGFFES